MWDGLLVIKTKRPFKILNVFFRHPAMESFMSLLKTQNILLYHSNY